MKSATKHPSRDQLVAFLGGRLAQAELAVIANHIKRCDACGQTLREIPEDELVKRLRDAGISSVSGDTTLDLKSTETLPRDLLEHPKYKLGKFLGRGGMGAVYQAEHRLMHRQVALKIIHRELCKHRRVIDRFRQEVKAAAQLAHPNIVTAYDAEQAGDLHFLVMEYVDGVSLASLVATKGPLEISHACNFIRQAAKGLEHAFEAGMVHRDIKPHNLMLTRKGQVKILDFGLARLAMESRAELGLPPNPDRPGGTKTGEILGTPGYMSPEQIGDPSKADIRSDIYSLGCTLYFLLAGQSPFADVESRTILLSPEARQYRPLRELRPEVPAGLVAVIAKMMALDPAHRYATPAEVIKALTPFTKYTPTAGPVLAAKGKPVAAGDAGPAPRNTFAVQCPFCSSQFRVPDKAKDSSIACPQCHSYFTAVPADDRSRKS